MLGMALLLSGCQAETANNDNIKTEMVNSTQNESTVPAETAQEKSTREDENEDSSMDPAQSLLDKYGGCQRSDITPIIGELFPFQYTDVIKEVEEIGSGPGGTDLIIHFEDSSKDIIVVDVSRTAEYSKEIDEKVLKIKEEMQLLGTTPIVEKAPLAGENGTYTKKFIVTEVEDTGVTYNEDRLCIVKSENGLEVLVRVATYLYGSYEPKIQEVLNFRVEDKVKSVESIYGPYAVIHFENAYNDMVVFDKSNVNSNGGDGDILAIKETLNQKDINHQFQQVENLPEAGDFVSYEKSCEVAKITLEKEDDKNKYFLIEGAGGIQDKWMVPKSMISTNTAWQYGTLNENEYKYDIFGITVDLSNIDLNDIDLINYAERRFTVCRTSELIGKNWSINFKIYEFQDNITEEEALSALQSGRTYLSETIVEDKSIAGKTYHTISLISFSGDETFEWYRVEDNRLYSLSIEGTSDEESILAMIHELK